MYAELIDVKYDLTALKHEFALAQYEKRKANYAEAARKFYAKVMDQFNIDKSMLDDFDKEIKDYSPELLKQSVLSVMQTIQSGKDQMDPDQLAGLIDFGSHLLDQADRKSRGLQDCNGSIL